MFSASLFALLRAYHLSSSGLGIGGGVSLGMGILLTSSGVSSSLVESRDPLLLLPSVPFLGCQTLLNVGALSPRASLAFFTSFSSFFSPSNTCSSCRDIFPPFVVAASKSSICFCILSGFFRANFSFRRPWSSALPSCYTVSTTLPLCGPKVRQLYM